MEDSETIWNWTTKYKLFCEEDEYLIGLFGSFFFFGFVLGSATLLRLADIFG